MSDEPLRLSRWKQAESELDFEEIDRWYVGEHCNRYPLDRPIVAEDVLRGGSAPEKLITRDTKVLAFGSCFAEYFIAFLTRQGYNRWQLPAEKHGVSEESLLLSMGQTFENVFAIVQQVRWAFGEFTPQSALWFTKDRTYFEATEERRENIRRSFREADVMVITLGLSEVWFDEVANEPMWRAITARLYDPERHVFRSASVAETLGALYEFDRLAEAFLPEKKFIFTLSPIPLLATFRDQSAITANQVSKATLRAALDEFLSDVVTRSRDRYAYFPAYELAFNLFDNPFGPDNRHVRVEVATTILGIFSSLYTDLPNVTGTEQRAEGRASSLTRRVQELERELVQKEAIIRDLDAAARARLAIIEQLTPAEPDLPAI
jgi:hypothetical protein